MAKYYISADLEGVCGVTSPLQCYPKEDLTGFTAAVNQLGAEITQIAQTLFSEDPSAEIVVNDAHSTMTNLSLAHLPQQVQLLSGKPKLCAMVAGLDATFDAVILVGYHAKAGAEKGVLNHTFHSKLFDVQVNGVSYGEGGMNALFASLVYQVPVLLASGDRAFCHEIAEILPTLKTVETKLGLSTTAARCQSVQHIMQDYRTQTIAMVHELQQWSGKSERLLNLKPPYTLRITFTTSLSCDVVMTSPLYKRIDGRTVEMTTDNFLTVYQGLQSAYTMLAYTDFMD